MQETAGMGMRASLQIRDGYAMYTRRAISYIIKGAFDHQIAKKESLHDKTSCFYQRTIVCKKRKIRIKKNESSPSYSGENKYASILARAGHWREH